MNEDSKSPVTGSAHKHTAGRGTSNRDWWPNQLNLRISTRTLPYPIPWARRSTTLRNSRSSTSRLEEGPLCADDGLTGLVAGRLRSLRRALHPDGVAQRGTTASATAAGCGVGTNALRPQQLAGQCEPRQGAPFALAIKQEYGKKISWADLMILAGNCALESMASRPSASAAAREDVWSLKKTSTGGPRASGLATSATPVTENSRILSPRCRWA